MHQNRRIAVVVPCHNEELLIQKVLDTMPLCVDAIIVVDDCSTDRTVQIVKDYEIKLRQSHSKRILNCVSNTVALASGHDVAPRYQPGIQSTGYATMPRDERIVLIKHKKNQGVGGAIASGYIYARDRKFDVAVVMAGDAQMDPDDFQAIIEPIVSGSADYSKGNRLFTGDAWNKIPRVRYLGNSMLSLLTKIASGYWHVADSQSGYTAISLKALKTIDWSKMYKRYGQPNDLLVRLNIEQFRVRDVPIKPVYNIGEKSGIKPIRMIPRLFFLLARLHLHRLLHRYVIRDFHPLVFFYLSAMALLPTGLGFGLYLLYLRIATGPVSGTSAMFAAFMATVGFQFLFFAMYFDMERNKDLR